MSVSIFSLIIVLGVLIFFHELGHFLVARVLGVGVERFSLGFGPKLIGKTIGITEYQISAIPLGGYVKMVGESPDSELDPSDIPISFTHKHVFKRILIVAAGPFFNILLALIIFFGIFQISGLLILKPDIGAVNEGTPAYMAGLMLTAYLGWVSGSALGGLGAEFIPSQVTTAMTMGLYGLFIGLLIPSARKSIGYALIAGASMLLNWGLGHLMDAGWAIVLATVLAAGLGIPLMGEEL